MNHIVLTILFFATLTGFALNEEHLTEGNTAYAYELKNIEIDGNLSDWPKYIKKFDIGTFPYNDKINGEHDLDAYFQVGYHLENNTLLFGVVIYDDANVIDDSLELGWTTQDTYSIYIDEQHRLSGSGVLRYTLSQAFEDFGKTHQSWDPALPDLQSPSYLDYKIVRDENRTVIEYSVKLKRALKPYTIIGLDHIIIDKDPEENSYTMVAWTPSSRKDGDPGKLGQLMLLPKRDDLYPISANLKWSSKTETPYPDAVILQSAMDTTLWIKTHVDSTGNFTTQLPHGQYQVLLKNDIVRKNDEFYRLELVNSPVISTSNELSKASTLYIKEQKIELPSIESPLFSSDWDSFSASKTDEFIEAYMNALNIPGVSLAIIDKGEIAFAKAYGVQNNYTKEPVNLNTRFEAASITKPLFAFAVLRLMEKGVIDLDKPLYKYLPLPADVADDPRAKSITARIVLSHSTGFPNWPWLNPNGKLDITTTPGTKYTYSGAGYGYLQDVIEHLTKKDIATVLKDEVIDVLDLGNTYFEYHPFLLRNTAVGHNSAGEPHSNDIRPKAHVASSMITDASSLSKFFLAILNRKGLKKETYDEFFKLHTITNPEKMEKEGAHYFGLGLYFEKTPLGLAFGHSGSNSGFKSNAVIFEDSGRGYVLLTNSDNGDALIYALYDFLFYGKTIIK